MNLAIFVCLLLPLAQVHAGKSCKYDPQDPEADPAYLKSQLCELTSLVKDMSSKINRLSECCGRPKPPPPPPTPPPTRPPIPENERSCLDIKRRASWVSGNKAYKLTIGGHKFDAYCHWSSLPNCGAGPWTMAMKINGNARTFKWSSSYWSNKAEYRPSGGRTGFDNQETKLRTYWGTPFTKICLGMKYGDAIHWIKIDQRATSLHALIADGRYRATRVGRNTWRSLISGSSLQPYCNREGFNAQAENPPAAKARIGLIANDADSPVCRSCDSFIGFGTSYPASHQMDSNSCGNEAIFNADHGTKHQKAFGYIMVQ